MITYAIWFLIIIYNFGTFIFLALLTNLFRYRPSLEQITVILPLVFSSVIISLLCQKALKKNNFRSFLSTLMLAMIGAFVTLIIHHQAIGHYFPNFSMNDVQRNDKQILKSEFGEFSYYLELKNPFAFSHKEFLVILTQDIPHFIRIPLFIEPVTGFLSPNHPSDWGTLEASDKPDIFILKVSSYLRKSVFIINIGTDTATEKLK